MHIKKVTGEELDGEGEDTGLVLSNDKTLFNGYFTLPVQGDRQEITL